MLTASRRPVESFGMQMTPSGPRPMPNVPGDQKATTRISDEGLAHLKDMRALDWLTLADARISDNGLKTIGALTSLKQLDVSGSDVTDFHTGQAELRLVHSRILAEKH